VAVVDIQSEKASRVAQEINAEYGEGMAYGFGADGSERSKSPSAKSLINAALAMPALYTSKSTREKISAVVDIQSEKASRVAQEINAEYGEGMAYGFGADATPRGSPRRPARGTETLLRFVHRQ
jgi:hypothetical protein